MSTDLNYVARVDTTNVMSSVAEIRSQIGMAFSSPTGFAAPSMAIAGGGFSGMNNVSSGVSAQFQNMFAGFGPSSSMFGTHTNPAMALSPHYGMNMAQTSLEEEWRVHRGGLAIAQQMKPPGVSAASYALGVEANFINRQLDANHAATMAAQSTFYAGVGGLAAGEAASAVAAPLGAAAGGAIATRLFGAGAAGAGKMLGGLGAAWFAFDAANEYIGGKIEKHYAEIEQIQGTTRELGELAGAGRGLNRMQRTELGIAARHASRDLGMDVQEMGDILALGRQGGMLPTATDPGKAREQYRDFARAIEEGAQVLQTSLAGATQVIKAAAQQGMSAQEGIVRAAGAGGADVWLAQQARMSAFGAAGAGVGMSMGFTSAQGSSMFTGSLGAAAGAGLSGDEMKIVGGRFGAAQFLGTTQMAMASSPMGNMQMMAAMGGGLPGAGMMDLPGSAIEGLMSGGGDFLSNAGRFLVHQNEYRRGIGASGIRTLARQQIEMGGEMIAGLMPDLSANEAERMYAMSMGMNPDQAKLLVGGVGRGGGGSRIGGGMGADAQARAIEALQESKLRSNFTAPDLESGPRSFGLGYTIDGAITGGMVGGPKGALVGGAAGFVVGNLGALKDLGGQIFGSGPGLFSSSEEKADYYERRQAAEYERRMGAAKDRIGYVGVDVGATSRFLRADLGGARLSLDGLAPGAGGVTESALVAMGVRQVAAGPGTVQRGGRFYSMSDVQSVASGVLWDQQATTREQDAASSAAAEVGFGANLNKKAIENDIALFGALHDMVRTGEKQNVTLRTGVDGEFTEQRTYTADMVGGSAEAASKLLRRARGFVEHIDETGSNRGTRDRLLKKLDGIGGLADPEVRAFLEKTTGRKLESLEGAFMAGRAGGAAAKFAVDQSMTRESHFLKEVYGSPIVGMMTTDQAARQTQARFYSELTASPAYEAAKEASLRGRDDEAKKLLQQARADVLTSDPAAFRYLNAPDIDPTALRDRPETASTRAMLAVASMGGVFSVDKELTSKILGQTSWKKEVKAEAEAGIRALKARKKRSGPGTLQRAVGFGQQETAMSSIQRSLAHVERSLRALDKRVSGPGAQPQASGGGNTTMPGGSP